MRPHIYLRKRSDTTKYGFLLTDPKALNEVNANPFTESAGVGGPYTELAGWQEWAQEDWIAGINRRNTDDLGVETATAITSTPMQLTLGPTLGASPYDTITQLYATGMQKTLTNFSATANKRIATFYQPTAAAQIIQAHLYMRGNGTIVTTIYPGGGSTPINGGAALATQTINMAEYAGDAKVNADGESLWQLLIHATVTVPAAGIWVVVDFTTVAAHTFEVFTTYTEPTLTPKTQKYQNSADAWTTCDAPGAAPNIRFPMIVTTQTFIAQKSAMIGDAIWVSSGARLSRLAANNSQSTYTYANAVTAFAEFAGSNYVAFGSAADMIVIASLGAPAAGTALTGIKADKLHVTGGYLWRALADAIYYTADGTDWVQVDTPGRNIEAMYGMEGELYYVTALGIYYVAPGDYVVEVARWTNATTSSTYAMTNFDGNLWIIAHEQCYRLDTGRNLARMHPFTNSENNRYRYQIPVTITTNQNRLFMLTQNKANSSESILGTANLLEWSPEGWHSILRVGVLPLQAITSTMTYHRDRGLLFFSTVNANYTAELQPDLINPYFPQSSTYRYATEAWVEYPRFYGNRYLVEKHFDQVSLRSEGLDTNNRVKVYYRSETVTNYTLLGTIESNTAKLRWTGADLAGTWVQLAFLIQTSDATQTPRIKATILKYQSLISDRARWTLPIEIDASQTVDGWTYTADGIVADTKAKIKELLSANEPIIFTDVDDTEYEVSIQSYARQLSKYEEVYVRDERQMNYVYTIIAEQINPGVYTA